MKNYETILVLKPETSEAELSSTAEKYCDLIQKFGSTIVKVENWGKRELPHISKKQSQGIFLNILFSSESENVIDAMNQQYRIDDSIIKFQSHRTDIKEKEYKENRRLQAITDESNPGDADDDLYDSY